MSRRINRKQEPRKQRTQQTAAQKVGLTYPQWLMTAPESELSSIDRAHARAGTYGQRRWFNTPD